MKRFAAPGALVVALGWALAANAQGAAGQPTPQPIGAAAPARPSPVASAPGRFHLHRPGTDVDGDALSGNTASNVFVFRGNVVLHSDPKVDHEFNSATDSDEPITVTADEIDVDKFASTYTAKGHVHFSQGTRSGKADLAMLDERSHDLDLIGNADVLDGEQRARAAKMHYNTADKRFRGSGDVHIYEPAPTPDPNATATAAPKRKRRLPF